MLLGDTRDEFLDDDRLAKTCTAEQAGLAAADEWGEEVDDFDTRFEHFGFGGQVHEFRRIAVNDPALGRATGAAIVDGFAKQIEHAAEGFLADGHRNRLACVNAVQAAAKAVGRTKGDGPDAPAAEVLLNFAGQIDDMPVFLVRDFQGVVNLGKLVFGKMGCEGRADDLGDLSGSRHGKNPCSVDGFPTGQAAGYNGKPGAGIVQIAGRAASGSGNRRLNV